MIFPRIGNGGDVFFFGGLIETDRSAIVSPDRIVLNIDDVIDGMPVGSIHALGTVTDFGEVPITVSLGVFPNWRDYVVTQERVLFRAGDVIDGHSILGLRGTNTVLNNRGDFALLGVFRDSNDTYVDALFSAGRLVVAEGDAFHGKVVTELFPNFDMNDRGDIAFRVEFDDGSRAVLLATIPEPSGAALVTLGMIAAMATTLWSTRALNAAVYVMRDRALVLTRLSHFAVTQTLKEAGHENVSLLSRKGESRDP
jgi:hypothetical protein